jgi:hypothetical protein
MAETMRKKLEEMRSKQQSRRARRLTALKQQLLIVTIVAAPRKILRILLVAPGENGDLEMTMRLPLWETTDGCAAKHFQLQSPELI